MPDKDLESQIVPTHSLFSIQIGLLTNLRAGKTTSGETLALNYLLVSASTTFIESVLAELLVELCQQHYDLLNPSPVYRNIMNSKIASIRKGNFSFYEKQFKDLTGKELLAYTDNTTWLAIKRLFTLRNHLMHGKGIKITKFVKHGNDHFNMRIDDLPDFQKYLLDLKFLKGDRTYYEPKQILNNQVTNHFLVQSVKFSEDVHTNINKEFSLTPIFIFDRSLSELNKTLALLI